jgi:transcriptional regulator
VRDWKRSGVAIITETADAQSASAQLIVFETAVVPVTPSWYPTKHQTGKAVPTWNYVAVHAYGTATTFEDGERLLAHLSALTDRQESNYRVPWGVGDAPKSYIDGMCRAIIGIEIKLSRIEGKWKLSQNKPAHDRIGVINGLRSLGDEANRQMADLIEGAHSTKL